MRGRRPMRTEARYAASEGRIQRQGSEAQQPTHMVRHEDALDPEQGLVPPPPEVATIPTVEFGRQVGVGQVSLHVPQAVLRQAS